MYIYIYIYMHRFSTQFFFHRCAGFPMRHIGVAAADLAADDWVSGWPGRADRNKTWPKRNSRGALYSRIVRGAPIKPLSIPIYICVYTYISILINICTYKHICIYTYAYMYTGIDWVLIGFPRTVREYGAPRKNIIRQIIVVYCA